MTAKRFVLCSLLAAVSLACSSENGGGGDGGGTTTTGPDCSSGVCELELSATWADASNAFSLSSDRIVASHLNGIWSGPLTEGEPLPVAPDIFGPGGVDALVADGSDVFFCRAGGIHTVPVVGGSPSIVLTDAFEGSQTTHCEEIKAANGYLYWSERAGSVLRAPMSGGSGSYEIVGQVAHDDAKPILIAVTESDVYIAYRYSVNGQHTIQRSPVAGGGSYTFPGDWPARAIAADASSVFIGRQLELIEADPEGGIINSWPVGGDVQAPWSGVGGVHVTEAYAYVTVNDYSGAFEVARIDRMTGQWETLLTQAGQVGFVTLYGDHVYFYRPDLKQIFRVPS